MRGAPSILRLAGIVIAAVIVEAGTCDGDVTVPSGGGLHTIGPKTCSDNETSAWTSNGLAVEVSQPPCPFTILFGSSSVQYAARVTAPRSAISFGAFGNVNSYVDAEAMDDYTASTVANESFQQFAKEIGDTMTYSVSPMLSGYPGSYKAPDDPTRMVDSLNVAAEAMNGGGFSEAWKILPGVITSASQSVTGPGYVVTGSSATWRSIPDWDTTGYRYRWLLDGTTISNAQGAQYQNIFGTPGTYSLSNVATRADNSSDTVTRTVMVGPALGVSIDGPTLIQPGATCSWNAVISSGTSPYAYEWQSQGQGIVGYDEYYTGAKEPGLGATFDLQVSATDSHGAPGLAQITVTEDSSAPVCAFSPSPVKRPVSNPSLSPTRTPPR